MRTALLALTEELRRLRTAGIKTVTVSDESVAALRRVVRARQARQPWPEKGLSAVTEKPPASPGVISSSAMPPAAVTAAPPATALETNPRTVTTMAATPMELLPPPPVVTLPAGDKATRWAALYEQVISDATCKARVRPGKKVVLGVGDYEAKIMFVGEAPGSEEEKEGVPFVGPAGQLLTKMIQAMGLKRSDVYIGNIMNWRPDMPTAGGGEQVGNRAPTPEEMRYCLPFLRAQIEIVNPELLVALGSTAAQGLLGIGSFKALGDVRGKWHEFAGKPLMVTYHPSYILRNQSNRSKRLIWEDLLKVMDRVVLPISDKQRAFFLDK